MNLCFFNISFMKLNITANLILWYPGFLASFERIVILTYREGGKVHEPLVVYSEFCAPSILFKIQQSYVRKLIIFMIIFPIFTDRPTLLTKNFKVQNLSFGVLNCKSIIKQSLSAMQWREVSPHPSAVAFIFINFFLVNSYI